MDRSGASTGRKAATDTGRGAADGQLDTSPRQNSRNASVYLTRQLSDRWKKWKATPGQGEIRDGLNEAVHFFVKVQIKTTGSQLSLAARRFEFPAETVLEIESGAELKFAVIARVKCE